MAINFKKALKEISDSIPYLREIVVGGTVALLIVGVMLGVATDGSISMHSTIAEFLNGTWITNFVSAFTNLSTGTVLAMSLFAVVIIMYLFSTKGNKGKKGSNV